ncbi:MAG TPA: DUF4442 domain-containing protein [Thermoanaerobaculia bacterium]|nr:DUF4442 domain-containing protein [Thermoanaerobaculia bacterium]
MAETLAVPAPTPAAASKLAARMRSPWLMRGFMLSKLPLALVAGLRVRELDAERCVVTVPYGWRTTNPFRSTYFAALSMAAEMSTGAPAMMAVELASSPVALLIVNLEATFGKKATGLTAFTCEDGAKAFAAVAETLRTGEPATARLESVGRSPEGTEVARFVFTWSFKKRSKG